MWLRRFRGRKGAAIGGKEELMFQFEVVRVLRCLAVARGAALLFVLTIGQPLAAMAQEGAPADPPIDIATLPRNLSPWGMFLSADIIVQVVMVGLAFASFVTWTVWVAKSIELIAVKRKLRASLQALAQARSTADGIHQLADEGGIASTFIDAAAVELRMSSGGMDKEGIKERIASRLERLEAGAARRIVRGTGLLATIGATAPFVGLFGTVWGIMNSFIGISKSHTTNLAVVAPGIAEALLATALGLAAAIPAVVIYNMFSRSIAGYRAMMADASAEVLRLVSRDLDQPGGMGSSRRPTLSAAE